MHPHLLHEIAEMHDVEARERASIRRCVPRSRRRPPSQPRGLTLASWMFRNGTQPLPETRTPH